MAGIGFELKRAFKSKNILDIFGSYASAIFITSGPILTSILQIILLDKLLSTFNVSMLNREIIKASITYAYVFSMIISSGFIMVISRFISDKIFIKDTKEVLSSLIGIIALALAVGSLYPIIVYIKSPLPVLQKYLAYIIFTELIILYITMAYVSAIKNYKKVALSFVSGLITTLILLIILYKLGFNIVTLTLASISIGYMMNIIILVIALIEYFQVVDVNVFSFISYFKKHYRLFLINLFYTLGIFIHNIIFWISSDVSINTGNTFYHAPSYDTASFFAVLTTIPSAIIFVVRFETAFYERYKRFCDTIVEGGSLRDLLGAKNEMIKVLKRELIFIMEIQAIISIVLTVVCSYIILPIFANDTQTIRIFAILSISFFMFYMAFLVVIILIYFDMQSEALVISTIFLLSTILFTYISIILGEGFYGVGFGLSSTITLVLSLYLLNKEIKQIDYRLFSK